MTGGIKVPGGLSSAPTASEVASVSGSGTLSRPPSGAGHHFDAPEVPSRSSPRTLEVRRPRLV